MSKAESKIELQYDAAIGSHFYNKDTEICCRVCDYYLGKIQLTVVNQVYLNDHPDIIVDGHLYILCTKECRQLFEITPEAYL